MAATRPTRLTPSIVLVSVVLGLTPGAALAQAQATAVLEGTAYLGEAPLPQGTVVLHHVTQGTQGEVDSVRVDEQGRFRFTLPNVPNPARNDIFFASVRHDGVLYFGPMITAVAQLDSLYQVRAYDTLMAPREGMPVTLQTRSIFFEPDSADWRVTDLFQLRNDQPRTIVAAEGGYVWRHPLPDGIRQVETGEGEIAADAAQYLNGELVARAALPPGERLFILRYRVDSPELVIPVVPGTEGMDVLVREPAPPLEVQGLELVERLELEEGSTYIRFAATDLPGPSVQVIATEQRSPPRVEWAAVLLALVLTAAGLLILRPRTAAPGPVAESGGPGREALLVQIAELDESFEGGTHSDAERERYELRRAELLRRVRSLG